MRFAGIAAAIVLTLAASAATASEPDWTPQEAAERLHEDPLRAAAVLRPLAATDDGAAFQLMVLLRDWLPQTAETKAELRDLIAATLARIAGYPQDPGPELPAPEAAVSGSGELSMPDFLELLRHVSVHGESPGRVGGFVSCQTLRRNPEYLDLQSPWFGSSADNLLPGVVCHGDETPLPSAAEAYFDKLEERFDTVVTPDTGTIRYGWYRTAVMLRLLVREVPQQLLTLPEREGYESRPSHRPLETWSMMSLANRRKFQDYADLYEHALPALTGHYRTRFGMSADDALAAARIAMLLPAYEGHWAAPERKGLRYLILEGAPVEEIAAAIDAAPSRDTVPMTVLRMAYYDGAWSYVGAPDPLISVAVHRPDVLRLLLEKGPFAPPYLDELGRGDQTIDPNARNWFGKTPLMTAAEADEARSVRILLDHGADPDASLDEHPDLRHGSRTALMYAAANASAPVIEALLDAGADPALEDSLGFGAIDYLQGRGPTGRNPKLTPEEVEQLSGRLPPTDRTFDGRSALMLAAGNAEPEEIEALLDAGADPLLRDVEGLTALDHLQNRDPDATELSPPEISRISERLQPR